MSYLSKLLVAFLLGSFLAFSAYAVDVEMQDPEFADEAEVVIPPEDKAAAKAPEASPQAAPAPANETSESTESAENTSDDSFNPIFSLIGLTAAIGFLIYANTKKGTYQLEKRDAIRRYFIKFPSYAIVFILLGAILLAVDQLFMVGGGILMLLIGVWVIFNWIKKPTDAQMDQYIAEDLEIVKNKSLAKSDIDASQLVSDVLILTGFRLDNAAGAVYQWKKGKDGVTRFTPINFTSIIMTEHQLVTYNAVLDLFTGNALNETTDEYFYKDVVSVSTETSSGTFKDPTSKTEIQLNTAEFFKLTTSGGTSVRVFIKDPKLIEMMGSSALPGTDAEKAVQSIRKMLREKKS